MIVRTKTQARGGITDQERALMDEHAKLWIGRAMRTTPIEPDKIVPAIEGLYAAANLKRPRVVIVPSPLVMAFAYGASAAIWHARGKATYAATRTATDAATDAVTYAAAYAATLSATLSATRTATYAATDTATRAATSDATLAVNAATLAATRTATYAATDTATLAATDAATLSATLSATRTATDAATDAVTYAAAYAATLSATDAATRTADKQAAEACFDLAGAFGIECAKRWCHVNHGGNMWGGYDSYLTACRDILGLELPSHVAYAHWEQAKIHGGFRVMHEEFCMVCDFPEVLRMDEEHRPHCEDDPSHRWRDGWSLYHWHGTRVPAEWIEDRKSLTAAIALDQSNLELRRAACEILGWTSILRELKAKTIDKDNDPEIGELVEVKLPDLPSKAKFLRVRCGTGREFAIGIPPHITKALDAQAWIVGLEPKDFTRPEVRA